MVSRPRTWSALARGDCPFYDGATGAGVAPRSTGEHACPHPTKSAPTSAPPATRLPRRKPESGEGEDAWSAREAAQHVIGAELYYANAVCEACGYDGPESPFASGLELASPEAASAALAQATAAADSKIQHVSAGDLERSHERMGPLPDVFESWSGHLRDHAAQITAAGG